MKRNLVRSLCAAVLLTVSPSIGLAQENVFAPGWTLDADASRLQFQSVKNQNKVEFSTFATFTGEIDANGEVTLRVLMDSVDTAVDLRNVRMRFLLFETFLYPETVVSLTLDPAQIATLAQNRRMTMTVPFSISLHGVTATLETQISATLIDNDRVVVSSLTPVPLSIADFGLSDGVAKLEEAAKVQITPVTTVTFDFIFNRAPSAAVFASLVESQADLANQNAAAMEAEGEFSVEACQGRFDTMSQSNSIFFNIASARLQPRSRPVLELIMDIIERCPNLVIEVQGHTDSDGNDANNLALSLRRATAVRNFLVDAGAQPDRILTVGFGESMPIAENDTFANKQRNRRIEFLIRTE